PASPRLESEPRRGPSTWAYRYVWAAILLTPNGEESFCGNDLVIPRPAEDSCQTLRRTTGRQGPTVAKDWRPSHVSFPKRLNCLLPAVSQEACFPQRIFFRGP